MCSPIAVCCDLLISTSLFILLCCYLWHTGLGTIGMGRGDKSTLFFFVRQEWIFIKCLLYGNQKFVVTCHNIKYFYYMDIQKLKILPQL